MKHRRSHLIKPFLAAYVLLTIACSETGTAANGLSARTLLVGSTPGGPVIKSLLGISRETPVDFIRWDLTLSEAENGSRSYVLNIVFGEGQPNTRGFKGGGEKLSFEGVYTVSTDRKGEIYELKNERAAAISLVKLNDNLFHLLTPDHKLMVGNGGWSYTLSREGSKASPVPSSWTTPLLPDESEAAAAAQVIFDGRTPCLDFAKQYNLPVGNDCLKIKWKLTLSRDPKTKEPTTYTLQSTLYGTNTREGKWTIVKGLKTNSEAIIYRLDPDQPAESVSFLVGDENVIFFLDREERLFTGNSDLSFTLNRRKL